MPEIYSYVHKLGHDGHFLTAHSLNNICIYWLKHISELTILLNSFHVHK